MPTATVKPFAVGDRVRIVGSHSWNGRTGEITRTFESNSLGARDLKWIVAVDDTWNEAAVADSDIRHMRR
jgi:hypothetical protein